jgi:TolA-binding protein
MIAAAGRKENDHLDEPWVIIAVLGAAIFVFAFIRSRMKGSGADAPDVVKEMEETFEQFAKELEDDNRELMNRLAELKAQYESQTRDLNERIRQLEHALRTMEEKKPAQVIVSRMKKSAAAESDAARPANGSAATPVRIEPANDPVPEPASPGIADRYRQILDWHHQGKSMEYIAKQLGMNKGEVQLILKLSEREASLRAEQ